MASVNPKEWTSPNGTKNRKYEVRYKDGQRYRSRLFARKKDADAFRSKVETEINAGTHIARRASRKVSEAADALLAEVDERYRRGVVRRGTVLNYGEAFRIWIVPYLGDRVLTEIETTDVEDWIRTIGNTGRLTPKSVAHRLWYLKAMFEMGRRRKWVVTNPVTTVRRDLFQAPATRIREFTTEEVRHLLATAGQRRKWVPERTHLQRQCFVAAAAFCGMRWGEIAGLKARYVDLDAQRLTVRHTVDRVGNLNPPKTLAGNRTIAIPAPLATLLRHYLAEYPAGEEDLIFRTDEGKPIRQPNFYINCWRPLLKQAGLDDEHDPPHFHALRHFAGSWMIEHDWPLPDVAKALGHSDVSMTLRVYAHTIAARALSSSAMDNLASNLIGDLRNDAPTALLLTNA